MDTFITALRGSGAPLGPFGQPRTLWRLPSGRGKTHRTKWCRDGLEELTGTLVDHADSLCIKCAINGTTGPEFDWELALLPYVDALSSNPDRNAATLALAYAHATKHDLFFGGVRQVDEWVTTQARPRLQQMLADREPLRRPAHTPEGFVRSAAAAAIADPMHKGIDVYCKALRDPSTGERSGQDGIIGYLVNRASKVYRSHTDLDEVRALLRDHAEMLLADIDTFKTLHQVNVDAALPAGDFASIQDLLDAAWRAQARVELNLLIEQQIQEALR